jgi:nucleoside-diphosphate-sugar epimerase
MLRTLPGVAAALRDPCWRIVVTGGGGWLGRAALEILDGVYGADLPRRVAVFGTRARTLALRSGRCVATRRFAQIEDVEWRNPLVLHFAYLPRGFAARMPLAAYIAVNRELSDAVAALVARRGARGLLLPSSGAVYREGRQLQYHLADNPYGALKLDDEARFADLARQFGFPAAVFRIFNLSGPFMTHVDHYALGSILRDITAGRPIVIRAAHPVIRAYTPVGDLLTLGLSVLVRGEGVGPLDTRSEPAVEIGDLARLACRLLGRRDLAICRPAYEAGEPDVYVGDGRQYDALAKSTGLASRTLDDQILDTAAYLIPAALTA